MIIVFCYLDCIRTGVALRTSDVISDLFLSSKYLHTFTRAECLHIILCCWEVSVAYAPYPIQKHNLPDGTDGVYRAVKCSTCCCIGVPPEKYRCQLPLQRQSLQRFRRHHPVLAKLPETLEDRNSHIPVRFFATESNEAKTHALSSASGWSSARMRSEVPYAVLGVQYRTTPQRL